MEEIDKITRELNFIIEGGNNGNNNRNNNGNNNRNNNGNNFSNNNRYNNRNSFGRGNGGESRPVQSDQKTNPKQLDGATSSNEMNGRVINNRYTRTPEGVPICFNCNKPGHVSYDCPMKNKRSGN